MPVVNKPHTLNITGFAVACIEPDGPTRIRLVTSWQDLKDLQICEHARTTDQDLVQAQQTIPLLPVPALQKIASDLVFAIRVPQLGDIMAWTAPIFVVSGAVDAQQCIG
ncbi:MAG: hypothetical protein LC660_12850 [Desulfobacteraceae bacterium]|nr:hypothetical protein [Desulfobacteraceae bacterium]